jgi:hypothetical protein
MECKCGGMTYERSHTKQKNYVLLARLSYDRCSTCGMSGNFILWVDDKAVALNTEAIKEFRKYERL